MSHIDIQYMSDVHLCQRFRFPEVTPKSKILLIAGDTGNPFQLIYTRFLEYVSGLFEHVFLIAGNHDYFHNVMSEVHDKISGICASLPNVHFLNNDHYDLDVCLTDGSTTKIRLWGGTMWSEVSAEAAKTTNDYRYIQWKRGSKLTAEHTRELYRHGLAQIEKTCLQQELPCVVMTHHALHRAMNGKYAGNAQESAFVSHAEQVHKPPIRVFVNGHTHVAMQHQDEATGIMFVSNPKGYCDESGVKYVDGLCFRLSTEKVKTTSVL